MSRFGTQYQVSRPTGTCAATGVPLEPGSTCVATLCDRPEDEGFDRKDFSLDAWNAGHRPDRLFSFWRTDVGHPDAKRRMLVDDETLMDLFQRLAEEQQPQRIAFRFVLALILMRKRRLKFAGRRPAGTPDGPVVGMAAQGESSARGSECWLLRQTGPAADDPPIEVINPHLDDDDVRELTAQLSEILQGDF